MVKPLKLPACSTLAEVELYLEGWARREAGMSAKGLVGFALYGWLDCGTAKYEAARQAEIEQFMDVLKRKGRIVV